MDPDHGQAVDVQPGCEWRWSTCSTSYISAAYGHRQQHAEILQDSRNAMRICMWHKDQKSVCALVLAIVTEAQTS